MSRIVKNVAVYPIIPMNFSEKLHAKIMIKSDSVRTDGTCDLFVQLFLNKECKKIPLNIAVKPEYFDKQRQHIKGKSSQINIIINHRKGSCQSQ